ncbi:MAG: peroxiredoxin, partial [Rikenellaceae bacterium]
KVVLYFYPKDNTPGCTAEACSLRDGYSELKKMGFEVVGVSGDNAASHRKFIEKQTLPFTLLADVDRTIAIAYGVYCEKVMCGRKSMGIVRTTFIIDENGKIEKIFDKVKTKEHFIQIVDSYK